jgi:NarL family two-component system response regulator LiaR
MGEVSNQTHSGCEEITRVSIILADDHPLMRLALKDVLRKEVGFEIVAEARDGEETVRLVNELQPDIVIMDISMPKLNGVEATRQIKANCPNTAVLVLTVHADSEHLFSILEAGAAGYLVKSVYGDEIVNAIRSVISGEAVLSTPVAEILVKQALRLQTNSVVIAGLDKLGVREMAVLKLAASGMSNKEIAHTLDVSLRTVKSYLSSIFLKLRVSSRTEAVVIGLRSGILTLDDLGQGS